MKLFSSLKKYFWKYRVRLSAGILFVLISNYFSVVAPQLMGYIINFVQQKTSAADIEQIAASQKGYDPFIVFITNAIENGNFTITTALIICGIILLLLALLRSLFMFFMRQTIIVMSRHIEYDQKNDIYNHYQLLDTGFFKNNTTGDMMNRITEDVSRVRMFTGPGIMYFVNLFTVISLSVYFMLKREPLLTFYVLIPLPLLAVIIYYVNMVIHKKSEKIQESLSELTSTAQEAYSGIRVIKSFVQEKAQKNFFYQQSENYRTHAIGLAQTEALYFPSITLLIGISTLLTIMISGLYYINGSHHIGIDTIVEFVMYINMLTFPVSAIGLTASIYQRASASQKRIDDFLLTPPAIISHPQAVHQKLKGNIHFNNVTYTYPDTGITALKNIHLQINQGQRIAILGSTGSGKTTLAQLILRMMDVNSGNIQLDGIPIKDMDLKHILQCTGYVLQDVFLFSESIRENIRFGTNGASQQQIEEAATMASVHNEIMNFPEAYNTLVGERGVTLSGGQKQRVSIARALIKNPEILILDDCLSALDTRTEHDIVRNLQQHYQHNTIIVITHRIIQSFNFDHIIYLNKGSIAEEGTHEELLKKKGLYYTLYQKQQIIDS